MASLPETVRYLNARNRVRHPELAGSGEALHTHDGRVQARFVDLSLTSRFDPIVDSARGRIVAHEALVVAQRSGAPVSSDVLFRGRKDDETVFLDRLCRTIHALNFAEQLPGSRQLLLNVSARHLTVVRDHGTAFGAVLKQAELAPERIVIQVSGDGLELDVLGAAAKNFRSRGFRVALDHFGRGSSNVDRLWALEPEIVRLDASLLRTAERDHRARAALARFVQVARSHDARVVLAGLDTDPLVALARETGADWLQGRATAALGSRPAPSSKPSDSAQNSQGSAPVLRPRSTS